MAIQAVPVISGSVNFGTEQAAVTCDPARTCLNQICAAVEQAGYTALPCSDDVLGPEDDEAQRDRAAPADPQSRL